MGRGASKVSTNNNLQGVEISEKLKQEKFKEPLKVINKLVGEYNTNLTEIGVGAEKAAGDVDITGNKMRINSGDVAIAVHEFAHTLANSNAQKYGLQDNKEFWKEIDSVKRAYHNDVDKNQDTKRWISHYEHSSRNKDEFLAEAFTQAKLKELGITTKLSQRKYGSDYTYSEQVLKIVDKYFKRRR